MPYATSRWAMSLKTVKQMASFWALIANEQLWASFTRCNSAQLSQLSFVVIGMAAFEFDKRCVNFHKKSTCVGSCGLLYLPQICWNWCWWLPNSLKFEQPMEARCNWRCLRYYWWSGTWDIVVNLNTKEHKMKVFYSWCLNYSYLP